MTSNTLERMLERYEKNVTIQGIANSSSTPVTVPTSEKSEKENPKNTTKHKKDNKHESMSNGNKLTNESQNMSQASEKSGLGETERKSTNTEKRRSTTAKKTISLSANFSALRGSSKRSYREKASAKFGDKQEEKDFKNNIAEKDLLATENGSSVGENIESNMDVVLTSKGEHEPINIQEVSEENPVPEVDISADNKLDISGKSEFKSESDLCESVNIVDTTASNKVTPGVSIDEETRLHNVPHKDRDGFTFESDMNSVEISVKSSLDDNQLATKKTVNISSNLGEDYEKLRNAVGTDDVAGSKSAFSGSENLFSKESVSLLSDSRVQERDVVTDVNNSDYMFDETRCISDGGTESFSRKTQDADLVCHSEDDTQSSCTEEETVNHLIITQNDNKQGDNKDNSCPNNRQFFTQKEAPSPDLHDSASGEGVVLHTDLPDPSNKNIETFIDVEGLSNRLSELATESSVPCIKNAKNETTPSNTVEHDSSLDSFIDTNTSPLKKGAFPTSFGFRNDTCASNTDLLVQSIVNHNNSVKDHDQIDIVDPFNNMPVSDTAVRPHLRDVVVNPITDTLSDVKLHASNIDEVGVCKSKEQDSGNDLECVDNTNNNPDTVKHDLITTLPNFSCGKDTNTTIDSTTFIHSSKKDLGRVDYENSSTSNSSVKIHSVSVDLHDNDMRDSLIDRTESNLEDSTLGNSEKIIESEKTSSDAHTNDAHDSIQFLKDCFPHTQVDLLKSFLNSCNGNLIKTVDCLLQYNKNDYEADTLEGSQDYDMNKDTTRKVVDINSPKHSSVSSPGCYSRDSFASPNEHGERDVALRYLNTPEDDWNSYASPLSESSTPKTPHDISVDSLQLTLDPALAYQLLEMFGAFSGVSARGLCSSFLL